MQKLVRWVAACLVCSAFTFSQPAGAQEAGAKRWYKGNLHTHSLWSDGDHFPEVIAEWYKARGYHFLAMTDHNTNGQGEKWMKFSEVRKRGAADAFEKYVERYGAAVRTRGDREAGTLEVKLRPLDEYRSELEEAGKFMLIEAQEVTDRFEKKPIHMNATNVRQTVRPRGGKSVREVIENNLEAVREEGRRSGKPVLPHLNHPNFQWGVTAEDIAEVPGERFFEVYNGHPQTNQMGDATRPGVERLWDIANTIRLTRLKAAPLYGLGTDDGHHYHTGGMNRSTAGRGWIMVRSEGLEAGQIIGAMERGDFYASSGVALKDVRYSPETRTVEVEVEPEAGEEYVIQFVGTLVGVDAAGAGAVGGADKIGTVFASAAGTKASYKLTGNELYVRAVITSSKPAVNPSFEGQLKQAWTQPVGWEGRVGK